MKSRPRPDRRKEWGFNLVEVLIAMALLSTVVLSITTLFFFGRSNVYSGKQMTSAVVLGTHVLEDLTPLTITQVGQVLNFELGSTPLTENIVNGVSYPGSILRSTNDPAVDSYPAAFLPLWRAQLAGGNAWRARTAYARNTVVAPSDGNGFVYTAVTAGSSAESAPDWPRAPGATVSDGTLVWRAVPAGGLPDGDVDALFTPNSDNTILKIRVIVSWRIPGAGDVGTRRRQIVLDSVKFQSR